MENIAKLLYSIERSYGDDDFNEFFDKFLEIGTKHRNARDTIINEYDKEVGCWADLIVFERDLIPLDIYIRVGIKGHKPNDLEEALDRYISLAGVPKFILPSLYYNKDITNYDVVERILKKEGKSLESGHTNLIVYGEGLTLSVRKVIEEKKEEPKEKEKVKEDKKEIPKEDVKKEEEIKKS